ncbi:MAG: glucose-phosphate cytidylyltransferase [Thermoleophilaceae bacterium]|jgi:glucose-1-phosphate cytidylyltransferase|nr:glucose-phosphate cytidylyltransferase [Thermoleophilaceae bacterium]
MAETQTRTVAILCGGRGTRLQEHTQSIPKPLVEIGGRPILWHVIMIYLAQGFTRFVLCTGYKGELIEDFAAAQEWPDAVDIQCVDTGLDTPTGGRLALVRGMLEGGTFCATYGDGLADIDLGQLTGFHREHGALATMTVVQPVLQFGVAALDSDQRVIGFEEKPRSEHWVNGGFFCFEPAALDYIEETSVLEREPLERLASDGELRAFRHSSFWGCMDTYKDAVTLNDVWADGHAPWKLWK